MRCRQVTFVRDNLQHYGSDLQAENSRRAFREHQGNKPDTIWNTSYLRSIKYLVLFMKDIYTAILFILYCNTSWTTSSTRRASWRPKDTEDPDEAARTGCPPPGSHLTTWVWWRTSAWSVTLTRGWIKWGCIWFSDEFIICCDNIVNTR